MSEPTYDVIVIGAGPGGYVAAIRAAQLGLKTAVAEREHLGGVCLNWGCIPTKALLRSADVYRSLARAADYGLPAVPPGEIDIRAVAARARAAANQLNAGVNYLLKKNKVDVLWGEARIVRPGEISVGAASKPPLDATPPPPRGKLKPGTYTAKHIIVATGARPRVIPGLEPDGHLVWTHAEAMTPQHLPKSLLIVGAGAIGTEFATFYRTFGTEVTLIEIQPRILPGEDEEISQLARHGFEQQGIRVLTGTQLGNVARAQGRITADVLTRDGKAGQVSAERLLCAAGAVGNVQGLGLEQLGVAIEKGAIVTDGLGRTNVTGLYAIGDVAGPPLLAHKAAHEGVACVEAIAGLEPHPLDRHQIPACTYSHPQIASVGLTEAEAAAAGRPLRIGRFPFRGNGKAVTLGEAEGLVKTVFDAASGELLGAHMIGAEVTELIHGFAVAMRLETTEAELMRTVFPHPTLSEMLHESVLAAYGRALHI